MTKRLIPLIKWPEHHPFPNVSGLRHLVFHAQKNGFQACVCRIGRRVLIDEEAYFAWVIEQNKRGA